MKFSIITPSLNQGAFIEQTIQSVLEQNYVPVEHIIIDGASSDSTVDILKKYPHLIWISEKDSGQSEAINKGFKLATGDILAWLNADDFYEKNIFPIVARYFEEHPDCFILYGDMVFVDVSGKPLFSLGGPTISRDQLLINPDIVRQPSFFWRREVLENCGFLDENLHLVMDYDYFLRISMKYDIHYLPYNISYFRYYSTTKTYSLRKRQVYEIYKVFRKHHVPLTAKRILYLLKKYLKSFRFIYTILVRMRGEGRA